MFIVLAVVIAAAVGGWIAGTRIESPAEAAARMAAPTASPILVPVERRVLSSDVVTRGTARFGLPQSISIIPSALKPTAGLITTLPLRNAQFKEGDVLLTVSGRPVFVVGGEIPAFRDLVPGISGDDVRQLEQALKRLGYDPGPIDGIFDHQTSAAVAKWYSSAGWEPFGPTVEQIARVGKLEQELAVAVNNKLAAADAVASAAGAANTARVNAEHANKVAAAELLSSFGPMVDPDKAQRQAIQAARAKADHANKAATANLAAKSVARASVALNPLSTRGERQAADAQLELARAAVVSTRLEGELAVQLAEREAKLAVEQHELAKARIESTKLEGEVAVHAAVAALNFAEREAKHAEAKVDRLAAELEEVRGRTGVQVPVDEIVFVPTIPIRVQQVDMVVGDKTLGPVMKVTNNQLAIDSSLRLNEAPLVKPGMRVAIDETALGIKATGKVKRVANTPGTHGVDGYHIYCEVLVDETTIPLEGFSLRLTIPIQSTGEKVTVVPLSALSLAADGASRVQVDNNGRLEFMAVKPGLSADGFVEVTPVDGTLEPGQLVVIGYERK